MTSSPKSTLSDSIQWDVLLFSLVLCTLLLIAIIVANVFQLFSLLLIPFSRVSFRKFNSLCAHLFWGFMVFCLKKVQGATLIYSGDVLPSTENALIISNHQTYVDSLILLWLGQSKSRLGDMKWFAKNILKYLPFVGWGLWCLDCIFLKRDWLQDQKKVQQSFSHILKYKTPVWLTLYAEGTRMTPQKLLESQKFARKQGISPTDWVMVPRTKGFVAVLKGLENHLNAIYDITLAYTGKPPSLWELISRKMKPIHLHAKRYPLSDLPKSEEALKQWLLNLFQEKDQLLKQFHLIGNFGD